MSTAAVSVVLFALLALGIKSGFLAAFDHSTLSFIHSLAEPTLDWWVPIATNLGDVVFVCAVTLLTAAWLARKRSWTSLIILLTSVMGTSALAFLLKILVDRARPELWTHLVLETSHSFPSGHATASAALALCFVAILWRTKWRTRALVAASVYVLLVAFTRLYAGVHYPTDILGGWIISVGWVAAVVALATYKRSPKSSSL